MNLMKETNELGFFLRKELSGFAEEIEKNHFKKIRKGI